MKIETLNTVCADLFKRYYADPYELFLTPESQKELTEDVFSVGTPSCHGLSGEEAVEGAVGVVISEFINPVTRNTIYIRPSEQPYDSMVVELRFPWKKP